jgi:hypothetical protein
MVTVYRPPGGLPLPGIHAAWLRGDPVVGQRSAGASRRVDVDREVTGIREAGRQDDPGARSHHDRLDPYAAAESGNAVLSVWALSSVGHAHGIPGRKVTARLPPAAAELDGCADVHAGTAITMANCSPRPWRRHEAADQRGGRALRRDRVPHRREARLGSLRLMGKFVLVTVHPKRGEGGMTAAGYCRSSSPLPSTTCGSPPTPSATSQATPCAART